MIFLYIYKDLSFEPNLYVWSSPLLLGNFYIDSTMLNAPSPPMGLLLAKILSKTDTDDKSALSCETNISYGRQHLRL